VGEGAIEAIVAAREGRGEASDAAGPFASLDDLCRRVDLRTVNKRVFESLVKAGAIASPREAFGPDWIGGGGRAYVSRYALEIPWRVAKGISWLITINPAVDPRPKPSHSR